MILFKYIYNQKIRNRKKTINNKINKEMIKFFLKIRKKTHFRIFKVVLMTVIKMLRLKTREQMKIITEKIELKNSIRILYKKKVLNLIQLLKLFKEAKNLFKK